MTYNSETENRILQSAHDVFLEKGRDGARMQEIADRAGINKALLHYYFRSKDKLFFEVFGRELKFAMSRILQTVNEESDIRDVLQKFIATYIETIGPRKNLVRFLLWESEKIGADFMDRITTIFREQGFDENPIVARIRRAVENGDIRPLDPEQLVISMIAMCLMPFVGPTLFSKIVRNGKALDDEFIAARKQAVFELVWSGIQKENIL